MEGQGNQLQEVSTSQTELTTSKKAREADKRLKCEELTHTNKTKSEDFEREGKREEKEVRVEFQLTLKLDTTYWRGLKEELRTSLPGL